MKYKFFYLAIYIIIITCALSIYRIKKSNMSDNNVIIQKTISTTTCTTNDDCQSPEVCITNSGASSGYCSCSNNGCQCSDDTTCSSGVCMDGTCQHCVGFGEHCQADNQCCSNYQENWCTDGICGGAIIAEAASLGITIGAGAGLATFLSTATGDGLAAILSNLSMENFTIWLEANFGEYDLESIINEVMENLTEEVLIHNTRMGGNGDVIGKANDVKGLKRDPLIKEEAIETENPELAAKIGDNLAPYVPEIEAGVDEAVAAEIAFAPEEVEGALIAADVLEDLG